MYELVMYDNGYYFERRWVFSRALSISEMMQVVQHSYNSVRYVNESLVGDTPLTEYSHNISDSVFRQIKTYGNIVSARCHYCD